MSQTHTQLPSNNTFILQWKPSVAPGDGGFNWESSDLFDLIDSIEDGVPAISTWGVSNFPKLIQPGDTVFMRRVGVPPLGIIGEGIVASEVFYAPSYNEDDKEIPYVEVEWIALCPETPLRSAELIEAVPESNDRRARRIQDPQSVEFLFDEWDKHWQEIIPDDEPLSAPPEPERRTSLITAYKRDTQFRRKIFETYGAQCFVCGIDEPLILEAAHIVPHAESADSSVENGRPLCANHHLAFDRDLLSWNLETLTFEWVNSSRSF